MVRGPISMVIVGVISLAMLAFSFGGGSRLLNRVLPESVLVWLDSADFGSLGTFDSASAGGNDTDPASHLRDTSDGWKADDAIAAVAGGRAVFVADAVAARRTGVAGTAPETVAQMQPLVGCAITPPGADALLGHVDAQGDSGLTLELATYGDAELAEAVRKLARIYRETGMKKVSGLGENKFDAYDVAVTETSRPVYLVLVAGQDDLRLWNIALAPGARVERVVLLGGQQVGVANLPDDVPVEVLRGSELAGCGVPGARYPLNPGHMLFQSLQSGLLDPNEAEQTLGKIADANKAWDAWFRTTFGVSANETMAGDWVGGRIALVGPVPSDAAARAEWHPLRGAAARITTDAYLDYPALAESGADFAGRVSAIAAAFAWGDLSNIGRKEAF